MENKGFYVAYEVVEDEIGFNFNISYHKPERDFQISFMILDMAFAIGWTF